MQEIIDVVAFLRLHLLAVQNLTLRYVSLLDGIEAVTHKYQGEVRSS
jgi:hypothetical protein